MHIIAFLNDTLRQSFYGGKVVMTEAVAALPAEMQAQVMKCVHSFDAFTRDNDPQGEHDLGVFELEGERFFFKIDYYNADMTNDSEDPSDQKKTTRVLTIGFLSEY
jgi:hypothetical protein